MSAFHELPTKVLDSLASSLRDGRLAQAVTSARIKEIVGSTWQAVASKLERYEEQGLSSHQMALIISEIASTKRALGAAVQPSLIFSGPDVPGFPMSDTAAVFDTLVSEAKEEIVLAGYAIYDGRRIFRRLADRLDDDPNFRCRLHLDVKRSQIDTSTDAAIVARFADEFRSKHWPGARLPELFYLKRSLAVNAAERASLHAKCIIADRTTLFITSANFTPAAHARNLELGIRLNDPRSALRILDYFSALQNQGELNQISV